MANINRGKQFEQVIKQCFECVKGVSIDRLPDQMSGFSGSTNICDFIVYKYPFQYYIECKTTYGNTFPLSRLTDNQYNGLYEKSKIKGVRAGVIIWWVDKDVTRYVPIDTIQIMKDDSMKSIRYDMDEYRGEQIIELLGKKKRVFFEYDMERLLYEI